MLHFKDGGYTCHSSRGILVINPKKEIKRIKVPSWK